VRYDPSCYEGAAVHYRSGRPPYSPQLEALLAEQPAWMAAEGFWTSGAVPASSPYDWLACSRTRSAWIPIRR